MAYIWSISLVAALGGLLFGYDWVVIGGAGGGAPFGDLNWQAVTAKKMGLESTMKPRGRPNKCTGHL
jgi:hypothetical protein